MQAIHHTDFGAPDRVLRLTEAERPGTGPGEVLVAVRAVGISKGDWLIAEGLPYMARPMYGIRRPKHPVAGLEFAGVVETVGEGVERFTPGDAVFGWGNGALAEYVVVPDTQLAPKPDTIDFDEAAAVPVSGFAALQALRVGGGLESGDRVLVLGASGGVGSFAVQIAKALGAEVTGVASTRNVDLVRSLGADHVVDYTSEEITGTFDLVVDIAGNRGIGTLRRLLRPGGTVVIVGGSGGKATMGFGRTVQAVLASPFVRGRLRSLISKPNAEDLEVLADLLATRAVVPAVGARYPLDRASEAIGLLGAGRSSGKTVVEIR